jgi:hypothetical protein
MVGELFRHAAAGPFARTGDQYYFPSEVGHVRNYTASPTKWPTCNEFKICYTIISPIIKQRKTGLASKKWTRLMS